LIRAHAATDPRLHFIDMTAAILGAGGKPDRSLFRIDRLHPNTRGYAVWTAKIKPILLADLMPVQ
jgi:lysophospholipase L1-like esterase